MDRYTLNRIATTEMYAWLKEELPIEFKLRVLEKENQCLNRIIDELFEKINFLEKTNEIKNNS